MILLESFVDCLSFLERQGNDILTIFPVVKRGEPQESVPYLLMEEALENNLLDMGEMNEGGSVNSILVNNLADVAVLILDGEELLGAKQNRMVNATVLLPPKTRTVVPVSCVERGRWRYSSQRFGKAGVFGYSTLRRKKSKQVASSLECHQGFSADQGEIWEEISRKKDRVGAHSPTEALHDVYQRGQELADGLVSGLHLIPGQTGVAVFMGNRFTCMDLFDRPETLSKVWKKLLESYAMEALEAHTGCQEPPNVAALLGALKECDLQSFPSVGLGTDLRLRGNGLVGHGLLFRNQVIHLSVFVEGLSGFGITGSRIARPSHRSPGNPRY